MAFEVPHPVNFRFAQALSGRGPKRRFTEASIGLTLRDLGEEVFLLQFRGRGWKDDRLLPLSFKGAVESRLRWSWLKGGSFALAGKDGIRLQGKPRATFGVCGQAWMLQFLPSPAMRFYGFGEKNLPFERSQTKTSFWNTDVWAEYPAAQYETGDVDPMYASIPWMLIKQPQGCVGILLENPHFSFMDTGKAISIAPQQAAQADPCLVVGAVDGLPRIYFIAGDTPADVVQKLQRLCGTTPLPPLWALGHHQCRWGYESFADLDRLDRSYRRHRIPCDGLWLDIDYMDRFKVFTFDKKKFRDPASEIAEIRNRGRHVVPILDPGVKALKGYEVYDDGRRKGIFCENPEAGVFEGFVWPGATAFPDFSLAKARDWWARRVKAFAQIGISGAWLDMNEPALGGVPSKDMLFKRGTRPHGAYHNQYGLGMAMASRDGFLRANPNRRPFLLSRAGFIGSGRFAALWTGDNFSNWVQLRKSIGLTLNLALSGVPFNGPDVPGFGGDASAELARAWYQAAFLFPLLRNHSAKGTRVQEPWAFGPATLKIIRHYIRLRYKLLPYLYNLFIDQAEQGSAILRPLFYEFPAPGGQDFDRVDDQFMVGPAILQAPLLQPGQRGRTLLLPPGQWFDTVLGTWTRGGRTVRSSVGAGETPLYVRDGSLIFMQAGEPSDNRANLKELELHVFLRQGTAVVDYRFDDGESFDYQRGRRTHLQFKVNLESGRLSCAVKTLSLGFGTCRVKIVAYQALKSLKITQADDSMDLRLKPHSWRFGGGALKCWISPAVECGRA